MKRIVFFFTLFLLVFTGCKSKEEGMKHFNTGMIFYNNGDYDKSIDEFKIACENEIAEGCYNAGLVIETKKVNFITKGYYGPEIYEAYEKGCELGNKLSCVKAKKWEEYKDGSFLWDLIVIIGIIIVIGIIGSIFGGSKRNRNNYTDYADYTDAAINSSDFHSHF